MCRGKHSSDLSSKARSGRALQGMSEMPLCTTTPQVLPLLQSLGGFDAKLAVYSNASQLIGMHEVTNKVQSELCLTACSKTHFVIPAAIAIESFKELAP